MLTYPSHNTQVCLAEPKKSGTILARFTFPVMGCYSLLFLLVYGVCLPKYVVFLLFSPFSCRMDYLKNCVRNAEVRSSTLLYSTIYLQ